MTGSVTGIRRRRTVAGRRETSHPPPDRAFYGQTLGKHRLFQPSTRKEVVDLDGLILTQLFKVHGEHIVARVDVDGVVPHHVRGSDVREGYCRAIRTLRK